ncbi:MAG: Rrf2 family transcriptional regulator [Paracraurococcus sp.]|jgi:Rrf2 family transcriptional regulator, iron-sulfur cluster assembly transcription factor
MRLSTRGRYAVMAMVELAVRQQPNSTIMRDCRPVSLAEIAQAQLLSLAYLEQLFGHLRRAGLVASARGPGGGYRLARPAAAITVADIVAAVDEPIRATRCEEGSAGCLGGERCLTHDLWSELGEQIRLFLAHVTLADVVRRQVQGRAMPPAPAETAPPLAEAAQ